MTLAAAYAELAALTVTGVSNLAMSAIPGIVATADLPALLPVSGGGGGLDSLNLNFTKGALVHHMEHWLLVSAAGLGRPQARYVDAITHSDAYLVALVGNLTLSGELLEPLQLANVIAGVEVFGNSAYYVVKFYHRWVIKL